MTTQIIYVAPTHLPPPIYPPPTQNNALLPPGSLGIPPNNALLTAPYQNQTMMFGATQLLSGQHQGRGRNGYPMTSSFPGNGQHVSESV